MASVSMEEFGKLQQELVEVKQGKMEAEGQIAGAQKAMQNTLKMFQDAEKNLAKANKTIAKSKKAKEMQVVMQQHQEELDEVRAQNAGLMSNLSELSSMNEKLEKASKSSSTSQVQNPAATEKQLQQLQDQVAQLQSSETELKDQVSGLQDEVAEANAKYAQTLAGSPLPNDSDDESSSVPAAADAADLEPKKWAVKAGQLARANEELVGLNQAADQKNAKALAAIRDLEENLKAAVAEKDEANVQLAAQSGEQGSSEQVAALEKKVKKKQANFLTLQDEKEKIYAELEALKAKIVDEAKDPSAQEKRIAHLEAENAKFIDEIEGLALAKATVSASHTVSSSELLDLKASHDTASKELEELRKVAQRRKDMLNTMATEKQELAEQHAAKVAELEQTSSATIGDLTTKLDAAKSQAHDNMAASASVAKLTTKVEELTAAKEFLERRQTELKEEKLKEAEEAAAALTTEKDAAAAALQAHSLEMETLKTDLASREEALATKQLESISKLSDRDVSDRKTGALLKDLKKQLKLEQRKNQKLLLEMSAFKSASQDALNVVTAHANDAAHLAVGSTRGHSRSKSGVSLKSFGGSQMSLAESVSSLNVDQPPSNRSTPTITQEEHAQLIQKVTDMQVEKADLTDQVRFLTKKVNKMADDLAVKSEIVMQYAAKGFKLDTLDGANGGGSGGLKGKLRGGSNKKASNAAVVTLKLQTVLEETLMKNIQLQKMVEILQKEATQAAGAQSSTLAAAAAAANPSNVDASESPEVVAEEDKATAM